MQKLKLKHNKKRNTAFLFESLTKELTRAIVNKDEKTKQIILSVIKEHFRKGSILAKELDWESVQLGHSSFYEPPEEVQEAIDEAGLKISALGIMPFKTQMNIYPDGHIEVN